MCVAEIVAIPSSLHSASGGKNGQHTAFNVRCFERKQCNVCCRLKSQLHRCNAGCNVVSRNLNDETPTNLMSGHKISGGVTVLSCDSISTLNITAFKSHRHCPLDVYFFNLLHAIYNIKQRGRIASQNSVCPTNHVLMSWRHIWRFT